MGKTSFALDYIRGSNHSRVFIYDHQREFAGRLGIQKVAETLDEFVELAETERVVPFDFSTYFPGYKEELFAQFAETSFLVAQMVERTQRSSLFVCDEIQQFVNPSACPMEFKQIVETGRRHNFDTLSLSQRPNAINSAIREQLTELVLFRLQDENSLKFAQFIGADVDQVKELPPHHYLYFNTINGGERRGTWQHRKTK